MRTLRGDSPDRLVTGWKPFAVIRNDPVLTYLRGDRKRGGMSVDRWGTCMNWPEDQPGAMPHITAENKALKDIAAWREVVIPDLQAHCTDWQDALETIRGIDRDQQLVVCYMPTGLFEQAHHLMGMEDTLCNLLLEPEDMAGLLRRILEYKMIHARLVIDHLKPDVILAHDDWGEKKRLFMSPETWRAVFKPLYAELYEYVKQRGLLVMHHADSFCEPIVEDMAEIGIDIWQGCLPQNDIPRIQQRLAGRMTLMGGIDMAAIDVADWTEAAVRAETRRACETYAPGGHFIPCLTYGGDGTIYPEIGSIIDDEIRQCSLRLFGQ